MSGGGCVQEGPLDMDALLSATQVAGYAGVTVAAVCNWVARGYLPIATGGDGKEIRDKQGRPRYRLRDAARADTLTSERAAKMARRITARSPLGAAA